MLNKLKELRESREEGFTLIELLVVIVIIGVLAAIALPIFLNQQKAAQQAAVKSDVRNAVTAVNTFLVKNPTYADNFPQNGLLTDAARNSPRDANTIITTGREYNYTTGVVAFTARWEDYVIVGKTSNDPTYWYAFESVTGKYSQSS